MPCDCKISIIKRKEDVLAKDREEYTKVWKRKQEGI